MVPASVWCFIGASSIEGTSPGMMSGWLNAKIVVASSWKAKLSSVTEKSPHFMVLKAARKELLDFGTPPQPRLHNEFLAVGQAEY